MANFDISTRTAVVDLKLAGNKTTNEVAAQLGISPSEDPVLIWRIISILP